MARQSLSRTWKAVGSLGAADEGPFQHFMIVSLKRLDRKPVAQRSGAVMAGAWHTGVVLYKSFANGPPPFPAQSSVFFKLFPVPYVSLSQQHRSCDPASSRHHSLLVPLLSGVSETSAWIGFQTIALLRVSRSQSRANGSFSDAFVCLAVNFRQSLSRCVRIVGHQSSGAVLPSSTGANNRTLLLISSVCAMGLRAHADGSWRTRIVRFRLRRAEAGIDINEPKEATVLQASAQCLTFRHPPGSSPITIHPDPIRV